MPPLQRKHLGDLFHQSMRLTLKGRSWKEAIHRCSYFIPQCPDRQSGRAGCPAALCLVYISVAYTRKSHGGSWRFAAVSTF